MAAAAASISLSSARANEHTVDSVITLATAFTASKSPGLATAKPASITSTRNRSSIFAILTFSSFVIEAPGLCSPSRKVVSKIINRSFDMVFSQTAASPRLENKEEIAMDVTNEFDARQGSRAARKQTSTIRIMFMLRACQVQWRRASRESRSNRLTKAID